MIDIDKKIDKIEKNCLEMARKELNNIKTENNQISEEKILEKVNIYKDELAQKYESELNKLEREFNRNIFDYEMNQKMQVRNLKKTIIQEIEQKVKIEFEKFTNSPEYKYYLLRNIETVLSKIKSKKCTIFITEKDYDKYYKDISMAFNIFVDRIDNDNIGGCVVIDVQNKVSIDNTLKTNIAEKVKQISF